MITALAGRQRGNKVNRALVVVVSFVILLVAVPSRGLTKRAHQEKALEVARAFLEDDIQYLPVWEVNGPPFCSSFLVKHHWDSIAEDAGPSRGMTLPPILRIKRTKNVSVAIHGQDLVLSFQGEGFSIRLRGRLGYAPALLATGEVVDAVFLSPLTVSGPDGTTSTVEATVEIKHKQLVAWPLIQHETGLNHDCGAPLTLSKAAPILLALKIDRQFPSDCHGGGSTTNATMPILYALHSSADLLSDVRVARCGATTTLQATLSGYPLTVLAGAPPFFEAPVIIAKGEVGWCISTPGSNAVAPLCFLEVDGSYFAKTDY